MLLSLRCEDAVVFYLQDSFNEQIQMQDVEEPESGVPLRVPQWIEATVACALTGGYAPPGAPETEIVHVVLRAHGIMAS